MAKKNEYLEEWESVQQGLDPGETVADRVMGNIHTKKLGWHRTRGRYPDKAAWRPADREFGWLYTPEAANYPSAINPATGQPEVSAEQRAAEDEWESKSIATHEKQRRDMDEWMKHQPVFREMKVDDSNNPDPFKPANLGRRGTE